MRRHHHGLERLSVLVAALAGMMFLGLRATPEWAGLIEDALPLSAFGSRTTHRLLSSIAEPSISHRRPNPRWTLRTRREPLTPTSLEP